MDISIPKELTTAPTLLNSKLSLRLPEVVFKTKERTLPTHMLLDTGNGHTLLLFTGASLSIRLSCTRPSGLQVVRLQPGTDLLQQRKLLRDKSSSIGRSHICIEEGMDIRRRGIKHRTQRAPVLLQNIDRLRSGDRPSIPRRSERSLAFRDEGREVACAGVAIEDGFVPNDNHLYARKAFSLFGPLDDLINLFLRGGDPGFGDEDAENDLEAMRGSRGTDVRKAAAVRAVKADTGEAFAGDGSDVAGYGGCGFAVSAAGVGAVRHAPLGAG